jgi:hypothetical protein
VLEQYLEVLRQIKARHRQAGDYLSVPVTWFAIEGAAVQLRAILELIALGSLVTHQQLIGPITSALAKLDAAGAQKKIRKINPDWYPKPVLEGPRIEGQPTEWQEHPEGTYLAESEWGKAYGLTSKYSHPRNPFAGEGDPHAVQQELRQLSAKLLVLFNAHTVRMTSEQYLIFARMATIPHGGPSGNVFEALGE